MTQNNYFDSKKSKKLFKKMHKYYCEKNILSKIINESERIVNRNNLFIDYESVKNTVGEMPILMKKEIINMIVVKGTFHATMELRKILERDDTRPGLRFCKEIVDMIMR